MSNGTLTADASGPTGERLRLAGRPRIGRGARPRRLWSRAASSCVVTTVAMLGVPRAHGHSRA